MSRSAGKLRDQIKRIVTDAIVAYRGAEELSLDQAADRAAERIVALPKGAIR